MMDGTDQNQCSLVTLVARWVWAACSLGETDWTGDWLSARDMGEACWLTLALNCGLSFICLFTHIFNRFHQMLDTEVDQTQPCPQGVARTCIQIGGIEPRRRRCRGYAWSLGAG